MISPPYHFRPIHIRQGVIGPCQTAPGACISLFGIVLWIARSSYHHSVVFAMTQSCNVILFSVARGRLKVAYLDSVRNRAERYIKPVKSTFCCHDSCPFCGRPVLKVGTKKAIRARGLDKDALTNLSLKAHKTARKGGRGSHRQGSA